jgi:hypothetical protein
LRAIQNQIRKVTGLMRKAKHMSYELVVAGGGLAGLCCALAAARKGVKTALVQDRPVLGGNSSSEIRVPPSSSVEKNAWTMETGIIEEILLRDRANNHDNIYSGYVNSAYDLCLMNMVKETESIELFLNTLVYDAEVDSCPNGEKRIAALHAVQLGNGRDFVLHADQFVDCTGDGEVGYIAGADFWYGREGRKEYNENLAPVIPDQEVMGATIQFLARDTGGPVEFVPPEWAKTIRSETDIGHMRNIGRLRPGKGNVYTGYWWMEIGAPFHQVQDTEILKEELLSHILGVWDYIKNYSDQKENAANYALEWVGSIPGKRESRRLAGDVVVTEKDCRQDAKWPDRIAYAGWFLDTHIPGGVLNKKAPPEPSFIDENYKEYTLVTPYTIPLRACYSRNISNLWMAGRNISVSHVALSSVRVQCTLANIGQAVGIAAFYALKKGISPREAAAEGHICRIQQEIIKDDVHVLGIRNEDDKDLARNAEVSASSEQKLDFGDPDTERFELLDRPRAQVFPVTHERLDTAQVFIKNETKTAKKIKASLQELSRIWEQGEGKTIKVCDIEVSPDFHGWMSIPFNARVTPNKPYRLVLDKADGVYWAHSLYQPTGTTAQYQHSCPGGCEPKNAALPFFQSDKVVIPKYKVWNNYGWRRGFSFAVRITPVPAPFSGSNVNNGYAWPFDMPNLWISEYGKPLPQHVTIDFGIVRKFNTVMISFDTNLNQLHTYMPGQWKSPLCARHWCLYGKTNSGWEKIYEEDNNYQRRRKVRFDSIEASAIKLEVISTNAKESAALYEKSARVYEIRVYNE